MADAPAWAEEARSAATAALDAMPELTGNEEEWRFTAPADLGMTAAEPAGASATATVDLPEVDGRAARLVFTDGGPAPADVAALPDGVIVAELGQALRDHEDLVRERLYSLAGFDDRPCALNAARWEAGTFVYVPRGVHLEMPVEAALTATGAEGRVFGRTLVIVEEGAKATVVDRYLSPDLDGAVTASTVVEMFVADGGELEHVSYIGWGAGVRHQATIRASAGKDARVRSVNVTLGGDVVRVEPTMYCRGTGAAAVHGGLHAHHVAAQGHVHRPHPGVLAGRGADGGLVAHAGAPADVRHVLQLAAVGHEHLHHGGCRDGAVEVGRQVAVDHRGLGALLHDHQRAAEHAALGAGGREGGLHGHLQVHAARHVHERAGLPAGGVQRARAVVEAGQRVQALAHQVLVVAQGLAQLGHDHAIGQRGHIGRRRAAVGEHQARGAAVHLGQVHRGGCAGACGLRGGHAQVGGRGEPPLLLVAGELGHGVQRGGGRAAGLLGPRGCVSQWSPPSAARSGGSARPRTPWAVPWRWAR